MGMMASQGLWSKPGRDPRQLLQTLLDSCHCSHLSEGLHWYRQPQRLHTYNPHVCSYEVFRAAVSHIRDCIPPSLDPHQFSYNPHRSTEDVTTITLYRVLSHLENRKSYIRMLFVENPRHPRHQTGPPSGPS